MFELVDSAPQNAVIKVLGVGGGGGNAVKHMISNNVDGVQFICANTDAQALDGVDSHTVLQLGGTVTNGLGAGANPDVGRQAALEDRDRITESLQGADMVFITAGMGGGTGTGGAPVVAEIARDMGILTVAVVTKPFSFEGASRMRVAAAGMEELEQHVDSLITIPNEKLLPVLGQNVTLLDAFQAANDVLLGAVQGIADLIIRPGMMNVDFADVRTVMSEMGMAMMGTGAAHGESRAREAAEKAIRSPLLEDVNLQGARGILVNITAGLDLLLGEFTEVGDTIKEFASDNATIVVGTVLDPNMSDELKVTVVATGLNESGEVRRKDAPVGSEPLPVGEAPNYKDYDMPTAIRRPRREEVKASRPAHIRGLDATQRAAAQVAEVPELSSEPDKDLQFLDIPAFIRRQAD